MTVGVAAEVPVGWIIFHNLHPTPPPPVMTSIMLQDPLHICKRSQDPPHEKELYLAASFYYHVPMTRHVSEIARNRVQVDLVSRVSNQLSGWYVYCNGSWWRYTATAWKPLAIPGELHAPVAMAVQEAAASWFDDDEYQIVAGSYLTHTNMPKLVQLLRAALQVPELPIPQPVSPPGPQSEPEQPQ